MDRIKKVFEIELLKREGESDLEAECRLQKLISGELTNLADHTVTVREQLVSEFQKEREWLKQNGNTLSPLRIFCLQEAEYRLSEQEIVFSESDVDNLALALYENDSWIDGEIISSIVDSFCSA